MCTLFQAYSLSGDIALYHWVQDEVASVVAYNLRAGSARVLDTAPAPNTDRGPAHGCTGFESLDAHGDVAVWQGPGGLVIHRLEGGQTFRVPIRGSRWSAVSDGLVVWSTQGSEGNLLDRDLWAVRFSQEGVGYPFRLLALPDQQDYPALSGRLLVWADQRPEGVGSGLRVHSDILAADLSGY